MNKFLRFLAYAAITSAILGILMAIISVIAIWRTYNPLTTSLDRLLAVADRGLEIVDRGLTTVDPAVGILAGAMSDIQTNGDILAAEIEESEPIVDTLSLLLNRDVGPKVEEIKDKLQTVQQTAEQVNAAVEMISALPFLQLPQLAQATQQFVDLMSQIDDGIKEINRLVDELKTGISQEVIGPIQERAALMEQELTDLQIEIQETNADIKRIHQATIAVRPMVPTIIATLFAILTLQLLWGAIAQVALIYLSWVYLKFGRLDFHNLIESKPEAINAS